MYANYTMQYDADTINFFSLTQPSKIEQKAKVEDLPNYLNTNYSLTSLNNQNVLQYTGYIANRSYPLSMVENDISKLIVDKYHYDIAKVHITALNDDNEKFIVFTVEIKVEKPDYELFLEQEFELSEILKLDKKNIILRLI